MFDSQESRISLEEQLFINNCFNASAASILIYDYILTFSDEYDRFWCSKRKLTWATFLFYLNRYTSLLGNAPSLLFGHWSWPHLDRLTTCVWISLYMEVAIVASMLIIAAISTFRTYILLDRKWWVPVLLTTISLVSTICAMIPAARSQITLTFTLSDLPSSGCLLPVSETIDQALARGWIGALVFESVVFSLTLYKALTTKIRGLTRSIMYPIIRFGTIYFGIVVLAITSVLLSFYILPPHLHGMNATLALVLSSTMVSRLMLSLRDPNFDSENSIVGDPADFSTLAFHHPQASGSEDTGFIDIISRNREAHTAGVV